MYPLRRHLQIHVHPTLPPLPHILETKPPLRKLPRRPRMRLLSTDIIERLPFQRSGAADRARAHEPDGVRDEDAEFEDNDGDVEDATEDVEFMLRDWLVGVSVLLRLGGSGERAYRGP